MSESITKHGEAKTIKALLESDNFKAQVAKALPKHLTPDRFIRVAATAIMRTPLLADCEQVSFFNALLSLSQLGIEPDGRRAHLIPFRNNKRGVMEVQLIVDYKGLVELAMRSGNVANIHADVVCENDDFVYDRGQITKHSINFRKPRGVVYAAYATVRFKDGTEKTEVMSREEIEAIRSRSKAGEMGPWKTDWNEMAKKTVFRRLSKWITLSPEYHDILEKDFDSFDNITLNPKANVIPPPRRDVSPDSTISATIPSKNMVVEEPAAEILESEPVPEPEPPPNKDETPDIPEPEYDLNTLEGLKSKIKDRAASHFGSPADFSAWLKKLTTNEEKGYRGIDRLDYVHSFNQAKFIYGSLKREIGE